VRSPSDIPSAELPM